MEEDLKRLEQRLVLNQLTEREQKILRLRYGLEDGSTHTLEEVAEAFGTSRERIRQIEAKAFRKIHPRPRRRLKLKDFLD